MKLQTKQFIDKYLGTPLVYFCMIFVRLLGKILRRNHSIEKEPDTIIIIKMLGFGSVILASDALFSLKKKYPKSKFVLLSGSVVGKNVQALQLFDEIKIIRDSNIFVLVADTINFLLYSWKSGRLWIVDLEVYSTLTTIVSTFTMAINRFGFELDKVEFRHHLNTHNIYFNTFIPVQNNYHELVKAAGVQHFSSYQIPVQINQAHKPQMIAINNTCSDLGGQLRKIQNNQLKEFCIFFLEKNYSIVFTGAPSDTIEIQNFIDKNLHLFSNKVINLAAKSLSIPEYFNFLKENCQVMISIDSAPFHIAVKLDIPTLSLWGPIAPAQRITEQLMNSSKHKQMYLAKPCSPCIHHIEHIPCQGNNICMKDLQVSEMILLTQSLISYEPQ